MGGVQRGTGQRGGCLGGGHQQRDLADVDAGHPPAVAGVHEPGVEQAVAGAAAVVPADALGADLDPECGQATVGHAPDDGAADDGGDADDASAALEDLLAEARNAQDRADGHHRVGRREQDGVRLPERLGDAGRGPGGVPAYLDEGPWVEGRPVAHPPLLEVDRLLPSGVRVLDDDVGLDPLVAHRQERDAGPPPVGERRRDGRQGIARVEHAGAYEMRGEVAVTEAEPVRVGAVGGELVLHRPGLAGAAPAALLVDAAAEGVHDRVEVRADAQPVHRDVVAGVDHRRDGRLRDGGADPAEKTGPSGPTGEHNYFHESHRAAWAVVDCLPGVSWCWTEVRKRRVTTDAGVASRLHRAKLTPEQRHACNSPASTSSRPGSGPDEDPTPMSERGRIVMAEVSWLSDYVNGPDRSERAARAVQSMAHGGSAFDRTFAGQGIAGLLGIGLEADAQSWQERALCAETDPEAFFPEKGGSTREAKKICTGCEVKAECLEYALSNDERFGIWGGLSERERRRLRRRAV